MDSMAGMTTHRLTPRQLAVLRHLRDAGGVDYRQPDWHGSTLRGLWQTGLIQRAVADFRDCRGTAIRTLTMYRLSADGRRALARERRP